jgi:aminomethyltransferase
MVPFAGYLMPLSYGDVGQGDFESYSRPSFLAEYITVASHNHVRNSVGLFDVSHMVQSK